MSEIKYSNDYIKAMCTMIARGDITDIDTFKKYLQYADLDNPVRATHSELDMLFGVNLNSLNPKYYISDFGSEKEYTPIDLILYSCICNKSYCTYKKDLFKEIIKIDSINFSNVYKTLNYSVAKGDLELFNLLISLNPDFNIKCSTLRNGEPISILDDCLSLAICRLTINGEHISRHYPKEIFNTLLSLENVDYTLLKSTKSILEALLNVENIDIKNTPNIFEKAREIVENYNN